MIFYKNKLNLFYSFYIQKNNEIKLAFSFRVQAQFKKLFLYFLKQNIKIHFKIAKKPSCRRVHFFFCSTRALLSTLCLLSGWDWYLPDSDGVVTVTGKQCLTIGGPRKRQALWWIGFRCLWDDFRFEFFNGFLACQILPILQRNTIKMTAATQFKLAHFFRIEYLFS